MCENQTKVDLTTERARASFHVEELTNLLDGGEESTQRRRMLERIAAEDPTFANKGLFCQTRTERYKGSLRKHARMLQLKKKHRLNEWDAMLLTRSLGDDLAPSIHTLAFVPNIVALFTPQQQSKYLAKALSFEIFGCYAQTELGHGSNFQSLETTATFCEDTDEFDLHTPSLSATKFWIGGLGRSATHAVVLARLIAKGKDHGVHHFMVQIRSLENHSLLPGIIAGDIGPKMGYNTQDNGFCRFEHVRIPRTALAMRHCSVDPQGNYSRNPSSNAKAGHFGMMFIRSALVAASFFGLARAVTIAVRYSAVRRQGNGGPGGQEMLVLDYPLQQYRIVPAVCTAYALFATSTHTAAQFFKFSTDMVSKGNAASMQAMHASLAALKGFCTSITSEMIEDCRKSCGGHGYLLASGLPELYCTFVLNCTAEGENYMLMQQTTRYLVRLLEIGNSDPQKPVPSECSYLFEDDTTSIDAEHLSAALLDPKFQIKLFEQRARYFAQTTHEDLQRFKSPQNSTTMDPWHAVQVLSHRTACAHASLCLLRHLTQLSLSLTPPPRPSVFKPQSTNSHEKTPSPISQELRAVLSCVRDVFALHWVVREFGEFVEAGCMTGAKGGVEGRLCREMLARCIERLRPELVTLVDAFDISDHALNSCLGVRDGAVYEAIAASTAHEPLNKSEPVDGWHELFAPYRKLKSGL